MDPPSRYHKFLKKTIRNDDVDTFFRLLAIYPYFLDEYVEGCEERPFHIACENGSVRVVREMIRIKPELAREKNKAGFYGLHLASTEGHIDVVRELVQLDPNLCLLTNDQSMIPLHIAVISGHEEVIRILLSACPESLQWESPNHETALHVALNYRMFGNSVKLLHKDDLLDRKDSSGNSVMTVAASGDSKEIMNISVNDSWACCIDESPTFKKPTTTTMITSGRKRSSDTSNLLLVVLALFASFAFSAACSPPAVFLLEPGLSAATPILLLLFTDTIFGRNNRPPLVFYYLLFVTVTYAVSVVAMIVLLWALPYTAILVLAAMAISTVFGIVVYCHTPRFLVSIGFITVPSSWFLWIFVLALVSLGFLIWLLSKFLCRFVTYLWSKKREKLKN